jgi:hypothetical protein
MAGDKRLNVSIHFVITNEDGSLFHSTVMKWEGCDMQGVVGLEKIMTGAVVQIQAFGEAGAGSKPSVTSSGPSSGGTAPSVIQNPAPGQPGHDPARAPGSPMQNPAPGQPGHKDK